MLMVSGSPLDPSRLAEGLEVLGPVIFHGYGQSELGLISLLTPREALASQGALASVGRPLPRTSIEIRGGEIFARTPYRAVGYWDDPQEQAEVFVDGWVRTRDLGHLDEEGYLHLSGRTRDVVIVNANVHYTGPIEGLLASDPLVDQAYVVGVPDERTGEAVHAFVLPRGGGAPDQGELRRLVQGKLGVDLTVTVIDEVPLGPTGKADKRALAARQTSGEGPARRASDEAFFTSSGN
jgi:fatty-acyl-CoA synthase